MSKGKILATMITLIASTSLCKAGSCPLTDEIKEQNITDLSKTGETTISGKGYKLVGEDKTENNYKGKLLNNTQQLDAFVTHGKLAKNQLNKAQSSSHPVRVLSVKTPEGYCAYNVSVGETSAVIAISTNPEQVKPARPSTPTPELKPARPSTPTPSGHK